MIKIGTDSSGKNIDQMDRRHFIRLGSLGLMGLSMADLCKLHAKQIAKESKAKAVIQLWMAGGPTHIDTFDPKPSAGVDYSGPYRKPIETNVKGIRIGQMLPKLAKHADKYSIIR